ncbi:unnamed protein product, partial [Ascophyllum nodosum]
YYFPCSADHGQDWQPYPVDPYSAICDNHRLYIQDSSVPHVYTPAIQQTDELRSRCSRSSRSPPVLSTCPLHTNSGCGKERRILIGTWSPAKAALVRNYLEVYWPCAGGSERHRYAIA